MFSIFSLKYDNKKVGKPLLAFFAIIIVSSSFWYTNQLVIKIKKEERKKVKLWASAIEKRAKLVKVTHDLFQKLKVEERKKSKLWALGIKKLTDSQVSPNDIDFIFEVVRNNETVPVILTNSSDSILTSRNFENIENINHELENLKKKKNSIKINLGLNNFNKLYYKDSKIITDLKKVMNDIIEAFLSESIINATTAPVIITDSTFSHIIKYGQLKKEDVEQRADFIIDKMIKENSPIELKLSDNIRHFVFYNDSKILKQLQYYPFVQIAAICLFIFLAYYLFSISRKSEQNRVWVGMSKETAHQLGTPISSLMAWSQYLEDEIEDKSIITEINKDIDRLKNITDRFSKIGSIPDLEKHELNETLENSIYYLKARIPKNISIQIVEAKEKYYCMINTSLFSWVIENLIKNAVDAMQGKGALSFTVSKIKNKLAIEIKDTGSGIHKSKLKKVFEPGFTSKKRGWGLGLTLVKRIIEQYHKGKIYISWSEKDKGTAFTILLPIVA